MRIDFVYGFVVVLADNGSYVFDRNSRLVEFCETALGAYEATDIRGRELIVLSGYDDEPHQIIAIGWDEEENWYTTDIQKMYMDKREDTLVCRENPIFGLFLKRK